MEHLENDDRTGVLSFGQSCKWIGVETLNLISLNRICSELFKFNLRFMTSDIFYGMCIEWVKWQRPLLLNGIQLHAGIWYMMNIEHLSKTIIILILKETHRILTYQNSFILTFAITFSPSQNVRTNPYQLS